MSISLVQQVGFSSSTPTITKTLNGVAQGNLLVMPFVSGANLANITISDNQNNTWNVAISNRPATILSGIAWATNVAGGNTTVTLTNTASQPSIGSLSEWSSGIPGAALSLDQVATASGNSTSPDSGPVTTVNNAELLIGMVWGPGSISAGSGWTGLTAGLSAELAMYQIVSSTGTYDTTATCTSGAWIASIATFLILPLPIFNLQVGRFTGTSPIDIVGNLLAPIWQSTNVTPVTVNANVSTDQNLMAAIVPANTMNSVGRVLRGVIKGVYSTPMASTATIEIKVQLGSLTLLNITTAANAGSVSGNGFRMEFDIVTQTAGSSAKFESSGLLQIDLGAVTSTAATVYADANAAVSSTLDSTVNQTLQVTVAFSSASGSNSCTQRQLILNTIN